MHPAKPRSYATVVAICVSACAAGCAGGSGVAIEQSSRAGLACVDDSIECIRQRQSTLRSMMDDKSRAWIHEPPTPEAYASGVRLFAFKSKKKELSCEELKRGKSEADLARTSLKSAGARLTHAQVTRGALLAMEVGRELENEMKRRCPKA